jgi:hypothetical protein
VYTPVQIFVIKMKITTAQYENRSNFNGGGVVRGRILTADCSILLLRSESFFSSLLIHSLYIIISIYIEYIYIVKYKNIVFRFFVSKPSLLVSRLYFLFVGYVTVMTVS